jgi:hypothetical protein
MKQLITLALLLLVGAVYCRYPFYGTYGSGDDAYFATFKNIPHLGLPNNVFAFATGHYIPLANINSPPFLAVLAAQGEIDFTSRQSIDSTIFSGVAEAFVFFYEAVGEYCEVNNITGFQENSTDYLIQAKTYDKATFLPITAVFNSSTSVFSTVLTESTGLFTLSCRAADADRVDSGVQVGPYGVKCDVLLNTTNFWATTTNCSNTNRYVGVSAYVATAAVDTTYLKVSTGTDGQYAIQSATKNSYFKYVSNVSVSGVIANVTADIRTLNFQGTLPDAVKDVRRVIFSFLRPKSDGGNIYFWDPTLEVSTTVLAAANSISASFSMIFAMTTMIMIAIFRM